MWATAVQLAPMVDVWRRLLADHQPDDGGRCRACTRGGTGYAVQQWPCTLFALANQAQRHHTTTRTT